MKQADSVQSVVIEGDQGTGYDTDDNALSSVSIPARAGARVVITCVLAGYNDRNISTVLDFKEGGVTKFRYPIHGADGFAPPSGLPFAAGAAVAVELPASGTPSKVGFLYVAWVWK